MDKSLKVYKLVLTHGDDLNTGVEFVALVDQPAIMIKWHAFAKGNAPEPDVFKFAIQDEDKHIISGPLMVAGMFILREDPETKEMYYVFYDAETINQIVQRFFKSENIKRVNLMHIANQKVSGVYMFESFIIDSGRGINTPAGFPTLPDGSWFVSYKVDNLDIWNRYIKTGLLQGFSVQGYFDQILTTKTLPKSLDTVEQEILEMEAVKFALAVDIN